MHILSSYKSCFSLQIVKFAICKDKHDLYWFSFNEMLVWDPVYKAMYMQTSLNGVSVSQLGLSVDGGQQADQRLPSAFFHTIVHLHVHLKYWILTIGRFWSMKILSEVQSPILIISQFRCPVQCLVALLPCGPNLQRTESILPTSVSFNRYSPWAIELTSSESQNPNAVH